MSIGVDADRDQRVDVDDAAALADLLRQRVDPDERVSVLIQRPVAECGDLFVPVLRHRADLRLRQLGHPEGLGELLDPAGGAAKQVCGGDHRDQGLLGPPPAFQQPVREVASAAELGDGQFDRAGPRVPLAWAISVAVIDPLVADLAVFGVQRASTSADMSASANVLTIARKQQVGTRRGEIVFREAVLGQTAGCGHRADLLRASTPRRSAGGRSSMRASSRRRNNPPDQVEPVHHSPGRNRSPM